MQRTLAHSQSPGSSDLEPDPAFNVVIVYEDFETGKHAKKTYDYLVQHLGHDCQFTNQMWKFDVLAISKLRDIAVQDALAADIIVVSSHGGSDLPLEVKSWVRSWIAEKGNAIALVALFDCEPEQSRPIRAYLAGVAKQAKLEFFAQPDEWPGRKTQEAPLALPHPSDLSERTLSTLAGVVHRDFTYPRWVD